MKDAKEIAVRILSKLSGRFDDLDVIENRIRLEQEISRIQTEMLRWAQDASSFDIKYELEALEERMKR